MTSPPKILGQILFWLGYPGIYFILRNSHRTRVIINADKQVLFVRNWLGENKFNLPGGGIKSGESSKQSALREVEEETSLKLKPNQLKVVVMNLPVREKGINYVVDCYSVSLPAIVETYSIHIENIESVWLDWQKQLRTNKLSKNTNNLIRAWLSMRHLVD